MRWSSDFMPPNVIKHDLFSCHKKPSARDSGSDSDSSFSFDLIFDETYWNKNELNEFLVLVSGL
jgi:hypothetical protein